MTAPTHPTDVWEYLGFHADPYYGLHLPVEPISTELFVGRTTDRTRLRAFIANAPSGKTMIQGPPGIGKTSLVNVVQQDLYAEGRQFPLFTIVETPSDATRESFFLSVISTLAASLVHAFGDDELKHEPAYCHARDAVTQTLRQATSLNLTTSLGGGVMGAGVARSPIQGSPLGLTPMVLLELLQALVDFVRGRGFAGVMVPVNNLDTLDTDTVIAFLNAVRDSCSAVAGVHWIFIGGAHLFDILEERARRISETFTSNPVALGPLDWTIVAEALERRTRAFAIRPDAALPISERVARITYEAAGAELRFMFTRLSRTTLEFAARYPSERTIPDELALALLREWAEGQLVRHHLASREADVLAYVAHQGTVRSRDYHAVGFSSPQRLSTLLRSLTAKGYLRAVERGVAREYRLSAPAFLSRQASDVVNLPPRS